MAGMKMTLTSNAFREGSDIPARYTCDGANLSPDLNWMHVPAEAQSLVLIVDDPDAPSGLFTHWILFDIPANTTGIGEGESGPGIAGRNDFQHAGYGGPCPPPNHGRHRYFFTLYALDVPSLQLAEGSKRSEVESAMEGHVLYKTQLMGQFQRTAR